MQASVVDSGHLDWADVARVFSRVPAEIGRLSGYERGIAVGAEANFTLYDETASRVIEKGDLRGKSTNSPYLSLSLPGRVVATVHAGRATVLDGALVDADSLRSGGGHRG